MLESQREQVVEGESGDEREPPARRVRIRHGIEGGILGTVVMTAYRLPVIRSLPPTADFWAKFVGSGEPEDYPVIGLVLHLVYGIGGGVAFAAILRRFGAERESRSQGVYAAAGVAYGLALSAFGSWVTLGALLDAEPDDSLVFHLSHVIYGLTLGTWIGSRMAGPETPGSSRDAE